MIIANVSIDVTKIDKSKLVKGQKGQYLNLTVQINDTKDKYDNDVSAWQSQSKEERENKADRNFLGNGRKVYEKMSDDARPVANVTPRRVSPPSTPPQVSAFEDDLPF